MADNVVRGACRAAIPVLFHQGRLAVWHLYLAAGVYGTFKRIRLAGIPCLIPALVPKERLATANASRSATAWAGCSGRRWPGC